MSAPFLAVLPDTATVVSMFVSLFWRFTSAPEEKLDRAGRFSEDMLGFCVVRFRI